MFAAEKCCQDLWSSLLDPNDNMSTARKHENKALSSLLNEELNGSASSQAGLTDPCEDDQKGACGLPSYAPESPSLGELQDLNQAIDSYRRALSFSSNSAGSRAHVLHLLSVMHAARFDLLYELDDINSAIAFCEEAISLVSEDEKGPLPLIGNLGGFYMLRCSRFGNQEDIERAMENLSLVVALTPSSDPELPMRLDMLGHCHLRRFECLGQPEDVHLAVKYNSQAVDLTSDENPEIAKPLCNLGIALQARFEHLGVLEDIDRAIEVMTRALAHLHSDPLDMAMVLRNLGTSYMVRSYRLKEVEDVDKAIEHQSHAISLIPSHFKHEPEYFSALGNSYATRFEYLGQPVDISTAIECHAQAMSLTPDGDPGMAAQLTNLGVCYCVRFQDSRQLEDLNSAIECHSLAVDLSFDGSMDLPGRLSNLGTSYGLRFEFFKCPEDLNMGIEYLARSISLISPDCSEMSGRLNTLGSFYLKRSLHPCNSDSLSLALSSWERASQLISGHPVARFQAALKWAEAASPLCPDRLRAYAQAISLIPHIVWLGTSVGRRYKDVLILENVANEAAAAAIHAKNYHLALEWLEQGRSIVWNQMLKLRTSLETLSQADSKLADQFVQVAKELDRAGTFELTSSSFLSETIGLERTGATHRRLAEQYESLLAQVRLIPGFEDFLAPMKASELIRAAQSGPTVMLNVHSSRCDALILLPGCNEIKHVPLPNISQEKVEAIRSDIDAALQSRGIRTAINTRKVTPLRTKQQHQGPEAFENSLAMLWTDVVKPVLDCLGYERQETVETLPHITWCATGVLSSLPLHASGDYAQSGDRLYDFAISSYTPTLAALLVDPPTPGPHSRLLVIGQEHTPGQSPLPETVTELTYIRNKATQEAVCYSQLDGSRATRGAVLEAMGGHDWVHLACHAHQNRKDPTKSGFFLDDGVLSLAEITQRSFNNKGLAFLSACQTAKGDRELPDESVHLASGMLIAGYRSVIATMWSIMDVDAPVMAETVYGQMIIDGKMNHKEAAKALHVATCVLRARVGEKEFARWVPYIHIGQ